VINAVIGSSIFGMPDDLARLTGGRSPLACLLAGLGVLAIVLCFAEVASRFDSAGGPYLYCREAFGRTVGFQAGWLTFWIRVTSLAANLNVFVSYLGALLPRAGSGAGRAATMVLVLGVVTFINLRGVRQATWTVDFFTVAKLAPLALLILLGLGHISPAVLEAQTVAETDWLRALVLLMFAYGGFETPLIAAGEVKRPGRDSAFALLAALAVIATVYMLVQVVAVGTVPNLAASQAPLADAFRVLLGPAGVVLAGAAAMVSVYGWATGSVLHSPRLLFSMAERGELPGVFARVHPSFRTPHAAILAYAGVSLGFALWGSFAWNAELSAIVRLVTYGLTCASLLVFRRTMATAPGFRLPGGAVIAPLGVGFCLLLLTTRSFAQGGILLGIMAVGLVLGWAASKSRAAGAQWPA
jgi:basic amino acid/polyamine antiporter, APA family